MQREGSTQRPRSEDGALPARKRLRMGLSGLAAVVLGGGSGTTTGDLPVGNSDIEREANSGGTAGSPVEATVNSGGQEAIKEARLVEILTRLMDEREFGNRRTVGPNPSTTEAAQAEEEPQEKKSWKEVWTKKCEDKLPYLRKVFAASNVEPTVCRAVLSVGKLPVQLPVGTGEGAAGTTTGQTAEGEARDNRSPSRTETDGEEEEAEATGPSLKDLVEVTADWITAVRFAKLPGTAKTVWLTPAGKIQSEFRLIIMKAVLRNVKNNPKKYMYGEDASEEELQDESGIPDWLGVRYMTAADINTVLARKQGIGTSKGRRLRKKQAKDGDVACYALEFLYTQLSKVLIYGRRRVDDAFFCRFGYIFVDWRAFPVTKGGQVNHIDQSTLRIRLTAASSASIQQKKLMQIPLTEVLDAGSDKAVIDARNDLQYKEAKRVCKELVVDLEHEVVVREGGVWEKKTEKRRIELLPLAVVLIQSFSSAGIQEEMFRAHSDSLKKAAGFATLLYELTKNYCTALETTTDNFVEDLEKITAGGLPLAMLMPGKYRSKEIIRKGTCLIGESTGR